MMESSDLENCDLFSLVFEATLQIPKGMVSTYGDIAEAMGDKAASRAVGMILSQNPRPIEVPCHRVVYHDGEVGWYCGMGKGTDKKTGLLRDEGVKVEDGRVCDMGKVCFKDFKLRPVLRQMKELQSRSSSEVSVKDYKGATERIVGLDVAYEGDDAWAAAVTLDVGSGKVSTEVLKDRVSFPYVPGYLSFRELPLYLRLLRPDAGTIVLVDGQGRLHPRRFGIASHLGVRTGMRSIGVAKSTLTGNVQANGDIVLDGETLGRVVDAGRRNYYVSIGHMFSLETAESVVRKYLSSERTDVLRMAHAEATKAKKEDLK